MSIIFEQSQKKSLNLKVNSTFRQLEYVVKNNPIIGKYGLELHPNARVRIDADRVELRKLAAINEATFTSVQTEDVVETFKNLFAENF